MVSWVLILELLCCLNRSSAQALPWDQWLLLVSSLWADAQGNVACGDSTQSEKVISLKSRHDLLTQFVFQRRNSVDPLSWWWRAMGRLKEVPCPGLLALPTSAEPFSCSSWFSHFLKKCTLKADWTVLFPVYRHVLRTWITVPCCLAQAKWSHSSASCTPGWLLILKFSLPFLPILQLPPQSHNGRIRNRDWNSCVLLRITRIRDSDLHIYKY